MMQLLRILFLAGLTGAVICLGYLGWIVRNNE